MTHLFEAGVEEFKSLQDGDKRFDILKFSKNVAIGDTVVYQEYDEAGNGEIAFTDREFLAKVDSIFNDVDGALKKGYIAVGFKGIES